MIQHYPDATQLSDLQRRGPPAAVLHAVRVMYAGAGREKLQRYAFGVAVADVTILQRTVNGQPGLMVRQGGATVTVPAFAVTDGRITRIWAVRNPEKLRSWSTQGQVPHTDMRPGQWR